MKTMRATLLEHAMVCESCRTALERLLLKEDAVQHALEEGIFPPMRRQIEIQRAHDLLGQVLTSKPLREKLFSDELMGQVAMGLDALCWALGHIHGTDKRGGFNFGRLLLAVEGQLTEGGYLLREILAEPKPPQPAMLRKKAAPMEFEFGREEADSSE